MKGLIHFLDTTHHQGLFNWEKSSNDVVVHFYNEVKTTGPSSIGVNLGEEATGAVRYWNVKDLEVFDFTKEPDENGVKVNSDKTLNSKFSFFAN